MPRFFLESFDNKIKQCELRLFYFIFFFFCSFFYLFYNQGHFISQGGIIDLVDYAL